MKVQFVLLPSFIPKIQINFPETAKWKKEYFQSCQKFILAETLSPTFVGMNFDQVSKAKIFESFEIADFWRENSNVSISRIDSKIIK